MTNESKSDRRQFLGTVGATTLLAQIAAIQNSVVAAHPFRQQDTPPDFAKLAGEYSISPDVNYLNHASIGAISKTVQKARASLLEICETNPWSHIWGDAWTERLTIARKTFAELLGCDIAETVITHNTTEMFNTLANGLPLKPEDEVLFSTLCHSGASIPFLFRARQNQYQARRFEFPVSLLPDITAEQVVDAYAREIKPNTRMLVISHLDNTVGLRYPVKAIADMARAKGVQYIAVDAAQTVGMISVNCAELGVDVLATSGHKWLGGPKGTGLAFVSKSIHEHLQPMWVTWGQAKWSDSARKYEDYGTRNLPEVLALEAAVGYLSEIDAVGRESRLQELWAFTRDLVKRNDRLKWNSPNDWDLSGSLYSIRIEPPAVAKAASLYARQKTVVRPFTTLGLNNLRISPNIFTSKERIRGFIEKLG